LIAVLVAGLGMGAACSTPVLTPDQIYQVARAAGFPAPVDGGPLGNAQTMVAIALRESGGCAGAHNPGPGEDSWGLWQINVQGNPGILAQLGLTSPSQLTDPATNAAAAFLMWGGNDANLNVAWYLNQPSYYQAYLAYLPAAQQAAQDVEGVTAPDTSSGPVLSAGLSFAGLSAGQLALGAGIAVALGLVLFKL
jgi:hypothetical protein